MAKKRKRPDRRAPAAAGAPRKPVWTPRASQLAVVFVAAVAARLAVISDLSELPLFRTPQLDPHEFLNWAQSIARGGAAWPELPSHAPGYPWFLGALLWAFGESIGAARFVQALLGGLLCAMVADAAARIWNRRAGWCAGLLLAFCGPAIYVDVSLLAEGLMTLLLVSALWSLLRLRAGPWTAFAAGALVGAAAFTRATALVVLPLVLIYVATVPAWPRKWASSGLALLAAAAFVIPGAAAASRAAACFVPLQAFSGLNLYMGNSPALGGVPAGRIGGSWDRLFAEPVALGFEDSRSQDRFFVRKTVAEVRSDPRSWLRVLGRKVLRLIQRDEIRETHSYHFFEANSRLLRRLPGFGLFFPLGLAGILLGRPSDGHRRGLLIGYLLLISASCVLIIVSSRYRAPLYPVLATFAGAAADEALRVARERRWKRLALMAAVAAAGTAASFAGGHSPSRNLAEEWALTGSSLELEGREVEALGAYERALALDPAQSFALDAMGRQSMRRGDWQAAESVFTRAVQVDPEYHMSQYHLGYALLRSGDSAGARHHFEKAAAAAPDYAPAREGFAAMLLDEGRLRSAVYESYAAVAHGEQAPSAWMTLARVQGAVGLPWRGVEFARRAAQAGPENPDAWLLLAMLSGEAGDTAACRDAVERAEALAGRDSPPVAFQRALLLRREGRLVESEDELRRLLAAHPDFEPARQALQP
ncbi:MAG: glycosyltransferase family 39 protein [Acidobacteriota bacterium]